MSMKFNKTSNILNMKQLLTSVLVFLSSFLFSCTGEEVLPNPDGADGKAYAISGVVRDASGKPVKGARIRVENPNGNNIHYTATSDEAGKYSIGVSAIGGYKIYAWKEAEYENHTYQVRLGMEKESDYDAFSVPPGGVTKNFTWKLDGRIPDRVVSKENGSGYFGGTIKFINYNALTDEMPAGMEVTIRLTPVPNAKFLDGTSAAGKIVEKRFTIRDGVGQAYYVNDIPATKYRITASGMLNGVAKSVDIGSENPEDFTISAEYYFKPEGGSGSYENGLISPNENYFYLLSK